MAGEATGGSHAGRILVADDEPHIRRVLLTLLRNASFEVQEARDGREAIEQLEDAPAFDFVLLDLMMPRADGIEVLEYIRGHGVHGPTPVIILTAKGQDSDRNAALARGANDFLTKPFSPKKLLARIQEILSGR
ncbi:MAG: response regulator [Longimicrobiales bacterium]